MNTHDCPLNVWYPSTVEPHIGESIMFVPDGALRHYVRIMQNTGVNIECPNEIFFGTYLGERKVEIAPNKILTMGVWVPLPLFFFESAARSILSYSIPKRKQ